MNQLDQFNQISEDDLSEESILSEPITVNQVKKRKKALKWSIFSLLLISFSVSSLLLVKINQLEGSNLTSSVAAKANNAKEAMLFWQADDLKEETNILILGTPGQNHPGSQLTDSILIAHIEPDDKKLVLFSLPRDLLVRTPGGYLAKINSLYSLFGLKALKEKITQVTDLECQHHIIINFKAAEEIIDSIDGLNINIPKNIYDPYFPGPNHSYQVFSLEAGWRYMNGTEALKYIRTRYTSPQGDFDRMSRQQQVLRAIKQKVFALNPLWDLPTYLKIYNSMKSRIKTNLTVAELKSLWKVAQEINVDQIFTATVDKKNTKLVTSGLITLNEQEVSAVWPRAGLGNYQDIKKYLNHLLNR